jgi:hypothetical protein
MQDPEDLSETSRRGTMHGQPPKPDWHTCDFPSPGCLHGVSGNLIGSNDTPED